MTNAAPPAVVPEETAPDPAAPPTPQTPMEVLQEALEVFSAEAGAYQRNRQTAAEAQQRAATAAQRLTEAQASVGVATSTVETSGTSVNAAIDAAVTALTNLRITAN